MSARCSRARRTSTVSLLSLPPRRRAPLLTLSRATGPFWVPTTLVFSLFLTSSLYTSIAAYLDDAEYSYDFTRLGAATSVVCVPLPLSFLAPSLDLTLSLHARSYTYYLGVPLLVWAAIKYWAGASDRSPVEIVSLYGYSSTVWILVAVRPISHPLRQ